MFAAAMLLLVQTAVLAKPPTVADLDTANRAAGNRMGVAKAVGERIFSRLWAAQIFRVSANGIGEHVVVGLGIYGVKFHHPLSRTEFASEISQLVAQSFDAAPKA
ncbi:MAG: hypothetical protein M3N13_01115, partial [Candidatus Eremiobacteraeota bacterium]|nr:hypothetical protein [Candidatus Eremiobacteraeota bacterium]